jgi:fumarate reductase subunit C
MSGAVRQARLWYVQRISAMVLALGVLVHLGVILYAVRGGLSGVEILARTHGNWAFGLFYSVFVLACAVHVPIGFAKVAEEWMGWSGRAADLLAIALGVLIMVTGQRAVYAVVLA